MLTFWPSKKKNLGKRSSIKRVDPLTEQVKKILTKGDQKLIVMNRG